jgi:RecA-family ATPase
MLAIASPHDVVSHWMGLEVLEHGLVLYLDFELDRDEQHTRVTELCKGQGVPVPRNLAYLSGRGFSRDAAFSKALAFCNDHADRVVAVIIDSVGQAMAGDMDKNRDVNAFYRDYIEPFCAAGVTPILVITKARYRAARNTRIKVL